MAIPTISTSLLLTFLTKFPLSLATPLSSALPPLATDTTTPNITRLPPTDRIITHGFNCSSLLDSPSPSYYIDSDLAANVFAPTSQIPNPLNARQSCLRAAQSVCSSFSATKSWTQASHGDCWVGIYNPPSAILNPSPERCFDHIFGPMIDTCINQTSAPLIPASPENATLVRPYDEASYNFNDQSQRDGNYPTYLVMSTAEFRNISFTLNVTLPGVLPPRREVEASMMTTATATTISASRTTTGAAMSTSVGSGQAAAGPINLADCERYNAKPVGICTLLYPVASTMPDSDLGGGGVAACVNTGSGSC